MDRVKCSSYRIMIRDVIVQRIHSALRGLQIQRSAQSNVTYDLFIVVDLGGLQHRKYLVKLSEEKCSARSECGRTYKAKGVQFERRVTRDSWETGRSLLPVLSGSYELMFDQDTNLLHSITHL